MRLYTGDGRRHDNVARAIIGPHRHRMATLATIIRQTAVGARGVLVTVALLAISVGFTAAGSFAIESWTGWPDGVTIPLMMALVFFVPPIGFVLA